MGFFLYFGYHVEDRGPLILQRDKTPAEFMKPDRYTSFDHVHQLQDEVRMNMREVPWHAVHIARESMYHVKL